MRCFHTTPRNEKSKIADLRPSHLVSHRILVAEAIMMLLLQAPAGMLHASVAARRTPMRAVRSPAMVAAEPLAASYDLSELPEGMPLSGLQGKAMFVEASDIPTKKQVRDAVPAHCFKRNTAKSMMYAIISVLQSAACVWACLLYTSPSPRDRTRSRMPSSA